MDALSAILTSVRLEGAVYLAAEFTAPWCIRAKHGLASVRDRLSGADQLVFFHFVAEGGCKVRLRDQPQPLDLEAGDVVLFSRDDDQMMGTDLRLEPVETESLVDVHTAAALNASRSWSDPSFDEVIRLRHGGGGNATRIVCGYFAYSRSTCRPLFEALPSVVRVSMAGAPTASLLRELFSLGIRESTAMWPGSQSMLVKLSELLFVETLRRYVERLPADGRGWLAGVRDPYVGRALALMHGQPARPWTMDELGREVALSRSALAERFTTLIGEPPFQYLMRWRLALAAQKLRSGAQPIARIAESSGYESEASFNRAFKREFGMPPAAWRRHARRTIEG